MKNVKIGNKVIGSGNPTFIIAEMSANHGGSLEKAIDIIHAAHTSGADAVKIQTYRSDTITLDSEKADFLIPPENPWEAHKTLFSLYEAAYTPWEWHMPLIQEGKKLGIEVFSSSFDGTAVDFLEDLNVPAHKIASPEVTDIPLIRKIGATRKPVIISTGVADLKDIALAVNTLREARCLDIILLKCTSAYPAPPEEINLRTIPHMAETFDCLTGISDHTLGIGVPVAAVSLGATVIEKHFILDKTDSSVDDFFSLDQVEFKQMVEEVRKVEKALGTPTYELTPEAKKNMRWRRSLYASKDLKKGEVFTEDNIQSVRPAFGLHPKYQEDILGRKVTKDIQRGDRLSWETIE